MFRERVLLIDTSDVPEEERHGELIIHKFPFRIGAAIDRVSRSKTKPLMKPDLAIDEKELPYELSRPHVEIGFCEGRLYIQDLDSAHGTIVNGQALRLDQPQKVLILSEAENTIILGRRRSRWQFRLLIPERSRKRKLLIADDESLVRYTIRHMFAADFDVIEAKDGREALDLARRERPDLVILDWRMPRIDGVSVCKTLKSGLQTSRLPVMLITGYGTDTGDVIVGISAGADVYMTKPTEPAELRARVDALLARSERARDMHWLTGLPTEAAFREEVDAVLRGPSKGKDFEVLLINVRNLGAYQETAGPDAVDELQREIAVMLWQLTLRSPRTVAATVMAGRWAVLLPGFSGKKIAGYLRGTGRDVKADLTGRLETLLAGTPVRFRIRRLPLTRCRNSSELLEKF